MIDTQAIRNKILDLAMRGQLTEQLPEDGTAERLYQQVQVEKQGLIKAGKIKKEKALPAISENDVPFEIPKNWAWLRWGNVSFQIQYGYNAPAQDKGRIKMVRITDIQNNKVLWKNVPYCDIDEDRIFEYRLYPNNILFARTGGTVGKSFLVEKVEEEAVFAGYLIRTSFSSSISAKYMKYFMESQLYWKQLQDGTTATAQPNCNAKTLSKMLVPLPPLAEQQRIVDKINQAFSILDTIDSLQTQYADNLTALKAKLIDAAIQGKLTEQLPEDGTAEELYQQIQAEKQALIKAGKIKKEKPLPEIAADEISIEIPENWKSCRLGTIITLVSGTDYKPEEYNAEMRGTPYITGASNLLPEGVLINRWTETPRCIANDGDVLLVCKGSGYGKVAMCDVEEAHIARQIMAIKKTDLLDMRYILYYLTANFSYLKGKGQGLIPGVDRKSVLGMIFPLPPLAEQKRIAQKIDELLPLFEK